MHDVGNLPIMTICKNKHGDHNKSSEILKIVLENFTKEEKKEVKETQWMAVPEHKFIFCLMVVECIFF